MICTFCSLPKSRIEDENDLAIWIYDAFPISKGHSLIIPKRHISSFFDATNVERNALFALLEKAKSIVEKKYTPDSFNIGINDGPAAGQTVPHLHMHLIPRYQGDVADPRGGIRWIIPERADYWTAK